MRQIALPLAMLLAFLSMTGCGFHLRGDSSLAESYQNLTVVWSGDVDFDAELRSALLKSGVNMGSSDSTLTLSLKEVPETTLAQSSSGLTIEQLAVELHYSIQTKHSNIEDKTIVQKKEFEYDSNQVLASRSEKLKTYKKLKSNAVRILMYQLQRLR